MASQPRGNVIVDQEECKGCGLCVDSCPPECLELAPELNQYGVHPAQYTGEDCTGCGACYYCCPEPGAITVERLTTSAKKMVEGQRFSRAEAGRESSGFSPGAGKPEVADAAAV
jgi:NAD-dependent dihydropyrimidine dehydrogenase PreA subunit